MPNLPKIREAIASELDCNPTYVTVRHPRGEETIYVELYEYVVETEDDAFDRTEDAVADRTDLGVEVSTA